jgi:hypothetical protein
MTLNVEEERIKTIFKQALLELFSEERDLFSELFSEVMEDIALTRAIQEGEETESVTRDEVFNILGSPA